MRLVGAMAADEKTGTVRSQRLDVGATVNQLFEAYARLGSPFNMIVLIVLIGSLTGVVRTIVKQTRAFASHRVDVNLKRELVERGLSVDEIERIVAVKSASDAQSKGC